MKETGLVWRADEYVSSILGKSAFSLQLPEKLEAETLATLRVWLESDEVQFVSLKTPVGDREADEFLHTAGFLVMDELVTLEKPWEVAAAPAAIEGYTLRWAQPSDEQEVVALAGRAFNCSRWHVDPQIPPDRADAMKATWAANYWRGTRGDAMGIVAQGNNAVGFLQVFVKDGVLVLDLLAVDEKHRGKGLGSALVKWVLAAWGKQQATSNKLPATVRVGTQGNNAASLALYAKLNFVETGREKVWHWHRAK